MRRFRTQLGGLLGVAWQTAPGLTAAYFGVAVLAGLGPLGVVVTLRHLIDAISTDLQAGVVPAAVVGLLATRQAVAFASGFLRWTVHGSLLDTFLRYRLQTALAWRLADKLVHLDAGVREDPAVQDLVARTEETYLWRTVSMLTGSGLLVIAGIGWLAALAWLIGFGWWVPPLLALVAAPRLAVRARQGAVHYSMYGSGAPEIRKLYYLQELLGALHAGPELRALGATRPLLERLRGLQARLYELNTAALRRAIRVEWLPALLEATALLGLAAWTLPSVARGERTVGELVLFLALCEQFATASAEVVGRIGVLSEDSLFVQDLFAVFALPPRVREPASPTPFPPGDGPPRLVLDHVSFAYAGGEPILDDLSLVIEPGEAVALVGENGAGKSTLVKLLLRQHDPTAGRVTVGGVDLRELSLEAWYARVGVLFQRFVDLQLTVRDGIALGDPHPDDARVRAAARMAHADGFVARLPRGYDQVVGRGYESGHELSWGQWQRLALARALYRRKPVLVLDEPTSAVDAEAEAAIFESLRQELAGHTIVFVSHRFSTVRNASRIVVLEHGRVAEQGTHEALVAAGGRYARMFESQARGYR